MNLAVLKQAGPAGGPFDAREIANFLLDYAHSKGLSLSLMSLLKLIYFAHGWHLAHHGTPLVKNRFEAWKHGPVVRAVWESLRNEDPKKISGRAHKFDPATGQSYVAKYRFDASLESFLEQVLNSYAYYHAFRLSDMTHEEGSPWHEVWVEGEKGVTLGMEISNQRIRDFFLKKASEQNPS